MTTPVSVIIPVCGQAARINAHIDHIRVIGYGENLQIIVCQAGPRQSVGVFLDRPGVILAGHGETPAGTAAMAIMAATGDLVVFIPPGLHLPGGAFARIRKAAGDGAEYGAFGQACPPGNPAAGLLMRLRLMLSGLTGRPCFGQAPFYRRLELLNLLPLSPGVLPADLELARRARRAGLRFVTLADKTVPRPEPGEPEQSIPREARAIGLLLASLARRPR